MTGYLAALEQRWAADQADLKRRLAVLEQQALQVVSVPLGAWTAYTPTWTALTTNPVIGNGSLTGRYLKMGRLVIAAARIVAGSTTTFGTGAWRVSVPFTTTGPPVNYFGLWYTGNNPTPQAGICQVLGVGLLALYSTSNVAVDATHPGTWASGNALDMQVMYEADS